MRAKPAAPAARTSTSGGLTACPAPRVARGSAPTLRRATPVARPGERCRRTASYTVTANISVLLAPPVPLRGPGVSHLGVSLTHVPLASPSPLPGATPLRSGPRGRYLWRGSRQAPVDPAQ
jgi:hypothetical protein